MTAPLLQLQNIYKSYDDNPVLRDVSLQVSSGEVIVILGPSGCGKSTLLRCLNGLEDIQSGKMLFHNAPFRKTMGTGKNFVKNRNGLSKLSFISSHDCSRKYFTRSSKSTKTK